MKKKTTQDTNQLSLFGNQELQNTKPMSEIELAVERFDQTPAMNPEEYKKWIRYLIHTSIKNID